MARGALEAAAIEPELLARTAGEITGGTVQSANHRDAVILYALEACGVHLPDLRASTVEQKLRDPELPQTIRDLLTIRLQSATTSTAKYKALLNSVSSDGRLRGTLQFRGASRTGRYAGRIFQPQNISRGTLTTEEVDLYIKAIKLGCADLV